jgi:hypothetical protein
MVQRLMAFLTRVDPTRNINRFYVVDVMPTLFGDWTVMRDGAGAARPAPCGSVATGAATRHKSPSSARSSAACSTVIGIRRTFNLSPLVGDYRARAARTA